MSMCGVHRVVNAAAVLTALLGVGAACSGESVEQTTIDASGFALLGQYVDVPLRGQAVQLGHYGRAAEQAGIDLGCATGGPSDAALAALFSTDSAPGSGNAPEATNEDGEPLDPCVIPAAAVDFGWVTAWVDPDGVARGGDLVGPALADDPAARAVMARADVEGLSSLRVFVGQALNDDEFAAQLRQERLNADLPWALLDPYAVGAVGWSLDETGITSVLILGHDDAADAEVNASRLPDVAVNGFSTAFSQQLSELGPADPEVAREGTIVVATWTEPYGGSWYLTMGSAWAETMFDYE
ncbi:MAG: hypothetical protein AAF467_20000 [Actinomycetota bacterium]